MDRAPVPPRVPKWVGEGKSEDGRWLRALMSMSLSTVSTNTYGLTIHQALSYLHTEVSDCECRHARSSSFSLNLLNLFISLPVSVFMHLVTNPPPSNTSTTGCHLKTVLIRKRTHLLYLICPVPSTSSQCIRLKGKQKVKFKQDRIMTETRVHQDLDETETVVRCSNHYLVLSGLHSAPE